ncbi:phosphate ABC transporter permease PstA [Magnetospirillum moscoviense]|uniref:Phosphate transport system permease protein PstA n=1 Tax=Magnetospirillum moscoviense TaxID=1437059 RepID=A0A178MZK2_9PROT|nr:phosphate ABC transporter permease PstA [Magnetospirillum moscoviense]MBF0324426.1 phosphate ABC transporter permease PstA [Alphaproteobacteria bacterium]OAN67023.1 phosphate ABC transporter permease [Magnetospirillum moscoviense]
MTDTSTAVPAATRQSIDTAAAHLKRRYRAERRFKAVGLGAILLAMGFLVLLLWTIISNGASAFMQTYIRVDVTFDAAAIDGDDLPGLVKSSIQQRFPAVESRSEKRELAGLLSSGADLDIRRALAADPSVKGTTQPLWMVASDDVDMAMKGYVSRQPGLAGNRLTDRQIAWLAELEAAGAVKKRFNTILLSSGDSREPELAGLWGAVVGSVFSLAITLLVSFPLGVATAVYLEEFAPKNRWTALIEVNINNLAAVPSVVFGLLGLAIFLNFLGMPRSAPLVGGLVLALICLPTIIIAGRAALKAVPPSIREAALGLGASKQQVVTDHVLPLAMPGIMTGTILGMAHALGETAPLLMIGMVAFIVDIPATPLDPSAVLPVQVYLWADSPERAFVERTSAAILVLLVFLGAMNLAAIMLRKKFERRW